MDQPKYINYQPKYINDIVYFSGVPHHFISIVFNIRLITDFKSFPFSVGVFRYQRSAQRKVLQEEEDQIISTTIYST